MSDAQAAISRFKVTPEGRAGIDKVRAFLAGRPPDETLSVAERRAALASHAALGASLPIVRETLAGVPVERHGPEGDPAIVYAHGGAYVLGSAATHRGLAAAVAGAAGVPLYAVDYRLAPEHPFPAARDDVVRAYRALTSRHRPLALFGDSAGGGLVIDAACALRDLGERTPAAIACTSPWADLTLSGASLQTKADVETILSREGLALDAERYAGARGLAEASPATRSLAGLPPTLIQVGEDEILLDDARRLADGLAFAGCPVTLEIWEGMTHSWHAFRQLVPEADHAIARLGAFLSTALEEPA